MHMIYENTDSVMDFTKNNCNHILVNKTIKVYSLSHH